MKNKKNKKKEENNTFKNDYNPTTQKIISNVQQSVFELDQDVNNVLPCPPFAKNLLFR